MKRVAIIVLLLSIAALSQVSLAPVPKQIFFGSTGQYIDQPLAGGFIYTYAAGTTTPLATYTDSTGSVANSNPIVLDAAGFCCGGANGLWLTTGTAYKFVVKDANGTQQYVVDNVSSTSGLTSLFSSPPPIGNVTPNTGAFSTIFSDLALAATPLTVNMMVQPVFHSSVVLNRTQITNLSSNIPYVDSVLTVQQGTVPSGYVWSNIPAGYNPNAYQFNIPFQSECVVADNAAVTNCIAGAFLAANITLHSLSTAGARGVIEADQLNHVSYPYDGDIYGTTGGSEFYNTGILASNTADGVGGVAFSAKSNYITSTGFTAPTWLANTAGWQLGSTVQPTAGNGYYYQITTPSSYFGATTSCTTGNSQPAWCTSGEGCTSTPTDGTCGWTGHLLTDAPGTWQVGYRAQDWKQFGVEVANNNANSSGMAVALWSTGSTLPVNILFSQGNPVNTANWKYTVGLNSGAYAGWWNIYNSAAGVNNLIFKPTGEIDLNSNGVGITVDQLSSTTNLYGATYVGSGGYMASVTGYKVGGVSMITSAGVDAGKLVNTTGTIGNGLLSNSATTVNGATCTLGSSCNVIPGTPSANQVVCYVSATVLGHCTSVVGVGGACTCAAN